VDLLEMKRNNEITNKSMLLKVMTVGGAIIFALCMTPLHGQEAAYFTFFGMLLMCILIAPHDFHHVLDAVEWDTLIFFGSLFVLVESL